MRLKGRCWGTGSEDGERGRGVFCGRGVRRRSSDEGVGTCIPHSNKIKIDLHLRFEDRRWWEKRTKTQLAQVVNQDESEVAEALTTFVTEVLSLLVRLPAMNYYENKKNPQK